MKKFNDFKQILIDQTNKRARICFYLPEINMSRGYEYIGKIIEINENTNCLKLEVDPHDDPLMKFTHLNLEAVVIYAIDEIPEEADLTEKPETKFPPGTLIKSQRCQPVHREGLDHT